MCNWVGKFKILFFLVLLFWTHHGQGSTQEPDRLDLQVERNGESRWKTFKMRMKDEETGDYRNGVSYILSGSLALVGGVWGATLTQDSLEKLAFTVFQTLGVASVGYGSYLWWVGNEDRLIFSALKQAQLTDEQKSQFLEAYERTKTERKKRDSLVRVITHGLIAGLNLYNGSRATDENIRNALYFIGGVNVLAAVSFSFEF